MRVAVTGATGFLGRHVIEELLKARHEVVALGRNRDIGEGLVSRGIPFVPACLQDGAAMATAFAECDGVVHCAALSSLWGKPEAFHRVNVEGTEKVMAAMEEAGVKRLVHVSSPSLYFDFRDRWDVKESDPLASTMVNAYAQTKWEAEQRVQKAVAKGLEAIILRPRGLFGPGDSSLFPRLLRANQRFGVPLTTSEPVVSDLTYVENAARATVLALEASSQCVGRVYNITNGEPRELHALLAQLFQLIEQPFKSIRIPYSLAVVLAWFSEGVGKWLGREPVLTRYGLEVLSRSLTLNIEAARCDLGYAPHVSVDEGLRRFAGWWMSL